MESVNQEFTLSIHDSCRRLEPLRSQVSGQVEQQDFGLFYTSELYGIFRGNGRAIASFKWRAVQRNAASRHLNVGMPVFLQFMLHRFAGAEHRRVQLVVLADLHGTVAPLR